MSSRGDLTSSNSEIARSKGQPCGRANHKAIRRQLLRILESAPFRTSKRYPAFLSHVVEQALQGNVEALKERTLGVEVFHRDPLYDTNADPVVRVTAGEVRKKLAQYYCDTAHSSEIRIEMAPGSYVPEFHHPVQLKAPTNRDPEIPDKGNSAERVTPEAVLSASRDLDPRTKKRWHLLIPLLCLIFGFVVGAIATHMRRAAVPSAPPTALDEFWRPLSSAPGTAWLCVGEAFATRIALDPNGARSRFDSRFYLSSDGQKAYPALNLADTTALARVAGLLQSQHKNYSVHDEAETTFSDLASGPSVLIGSFNNDWAIRVSDPLRFHFEMNRNTGQHWIADRKKPNEKIGIDSFGLGRPDNGDAYAIVSRARDPNIGQMVVTLAGLSTDGTRAASAFISEPQFLEGFAKHAPHNWQNKNLEFVIAAPIVDGSLGAPHIVSSYVW